MALRTALLLMVAIGVVVIREPIKAQEPRSIGDMEAQFNAEVESLEQKYESAKEKVRATWLGKMKDVAGSLTKEGNLRNATKAWERIVDVAPDDEDAATFFESIGREMVPDEAQAARLRAQIPAVRKQLQHLAEKLRGNDDEQAAQQVNAAFEALSEREVGAAEQGESVPPALATRNLLGTWKWYTGATVKFTRDEKTIIHLASGKRVNPGAWRYKADEATIDIINSRGEVTDRAKLACNGRMLEGVVAIGPTKGDRMWAVKIDE